MDITVLKYGGSSVGDFQKIKNIAHYIKQRVDLGEKIIVVVSAMGKTTDQLLSSVNALTNAPNEKDLALLLTTGEQQSISYLSMVLNDIGVEAESLTGHQAGIKTTGNILKSKITEMSSAIFEKKLSNQDCLVVAGFQGMNQYNEVTTLGRGGSDTTAVAIAASLQANCEIYTDVVGVYATDPRILPTAPKLQTVSYEEMMELSALGAGVLETRSIEIAKNYKVPIYIAQALSEIEGTRIMDTSQLFEKKAVTGVALDDDMSHVTLSYPYQDTDLLTSLFRRLEETEINIDMISQIVNESSMQFSFTYKSSESRQMHTILKKLKVSYEALTYIISEEYAKISLVGSGMRDMSGVASKAFMTLINESINFYQTTTSEISISYVIDKTEGKRAVKKLCEAFEIDKGDVNG